MALKIAINGFGRIGRSFFKIALDRPDDFDIVAINDLTDEKTLAYLLKYDTVYGRYGKKVEVAKEAAKTYLKVDDKKVLSLREKDPEKLPWKELGVDAVIEATGAFTNKEGASKHLKAGAERVIITAPAKDEIPHLLPGVSDEEFRGDKLSKITSDGSCTTNAVAPVMKIMSETVGVKKALLNTIHAYTISQNIVDGPHENLGRGRAAAQNIVPTLTGAAKVTGKVIKELDGNFDGIATRVPVICGSLADVTFVTKKETSVDEVNKIFTDAAQDKKWKDIFKVTNDPIVSSDIIGDPYASILDLSFTKVAGGDLVKVLAWYDNEWAYCATLAEHVLRVCRI